MKFCSDVAATNVTTRTNVTIDNKCDKSTTNVTTFDPFRQATNVTNLQQNNRSNICNNHGNICNYIFIRF